MAGSVSRSTIAPLIGNPTRARAIPARASLRAAAKIANVEKSRVLLKLEGNGSSNCSTGLPFLDHMMDQIPHHGLFDLDLQVDGDVPAAEDKNELAGLAFGNALRQGLQGLPAESGISLAGSMYVPLDEALVEVSLDLNGEPHLDYNLKIPTKLVGTYDTQLVEQFFRSVVQSTGMNLRINQCAGKNSHHIIEAAFKAFAKALRQAVEVSGRRNSAAASGSRTGSIRRLTKETQIGIELCLDGTGESNCKTSIPFLDRMLKEIVRGGNFDLSVDAVGDTHIDDHHTSEDIALSTGAALLQALGDRKGIHRFAYSFACDNLIRVCLDLSGRPHSNFAVDITDERVDGYDTQLVEHFFQSLVSTSGLTLHIHQLSSGTSEQLITAAFQAFGVALGRAVSYDPRRRGSVPSSKGILTRS